MRLIGGIFAALIVLAPIGALAGPVTIVDGSGVQQGTVGNPLYVSGGSGGSTTVTNFPATVDTNTGAAGASTLRVTPSTASTTDASSTVATGGTFQTVFALSTTRKGCFIQNPTTATEALYVAIGTSPAAATTNSASLGPGSSFNCATGNIVISDLIAVTATTNGHAFIAKSQ